MAMFQASAKVGTILGYKENVNAIATIMNLAPGTQPQSAAVTQAAQGAATQGGASSEFMALLGSLMGNAGTSANAGVSVPANVLTTASKKVSSDLNDDSTAAATTVASLLGVQVAAQATLQTLSVNGEAVNADAQVSSVEGASADAPQMPQTPQIAAPQVAIETIDTPQTAPVNESTAKPAAVNQTMAAPVEANAAAPASTAPAATVAVETPFADLLAQAGGMSPQSPVSTNEAISAYTQSQPLAAKININAPQAQPVSMTAQPTINVEVTSINVASAASFVAAEPIVASNAVAPQIEAMAEVIDSPAPQAEAVVANSVASQVSATPQMMAASKVATLTVTSEPAKPVVSDNAAPQVSEPIATNSASKVAVMTKQVEATPKQTVAEPITAGQAKAAAPQAGVTPQASEPIATNSEPKVAVMTEQVEATPKQTVAEPITAGQAKAAAPQAGVTPQFAEPIVTNNVAAPQVSEPIATNSEPKVAVMTKQVAATPKQTIAEPITAGQTKAAAPQAGVTPQVAEPVVISNVAAPQAGVTPQVAEPVVINNVAAPQAGVTPQVAEPAVINNVAAPQAGVTPQVAESAVINNVEAPQAGVTPQVAESVVSSNTQPHAEPAKPVVVTKATAPQVAAAPVAPVVATEIAAAPQVATQVAAAVEPAAAPKKSEAAAATAKVAADSTQNTEAERPLSYSEVIARLTGDKTSTQTVKKDAPASSSNTTIPTKAPQQQAAVSSDMTETALDPKAAAVAAPVAEPSQGIATESARAFALGQTTLTEAGSLDAEGAKSASHAKSNNAASIIPGFEGQVQANTADTAVKAQIASSATLNQAKVVQVNDYTFTMVRRSDSSLELTLQPEGLGKLHLEVSVDKGVVSAHISAPDQATRQIIERSVQSILNELQKDGVNVGGFSVDVRGGDGGNAAGRNRNSTRTAAGADDTEISLEAAQAASAPKDANALLSVYA